MGIGEKQANRRALIERVQDCLKQTNTMTALATDVREAHNKLAQQTGDDIASLKARLDTLSAWCKRLEAAAAVEARRHTLTRSELSQMTIERDAFLGLTFWGRLRWILSGGWTKPGTYADVTNHGDRLAAVQSDKPTMLVIDRPDPPAESFASPLQGYIPHTSLGPRVLP
jgi:hypothetical protein